MASASVRKAGTPRLGDRLSARVAAEGTAAHSYPKSEALLKGPGAARNLADAVHLLCTLHGRHPGVIDQAAARSADPSAREWFSGTVQAFAEERALLTRLVVAAGPIPSTPGASETEAAVLGQRHAMEMLARSERTGCAIGAAMAVALDWIAIRPVLALGAERFGIEAPRFGFEAADIEKVAEAVAVTPAVERALLFGAEQISIQHFALWELLEARQQARA